MAQRDRDAEEQKENHDISMRFEKFMQPARPQVA